MKKKCEITSYFYQPRIFSDAIPVHRVGCVGTARPLRLQPTRPHRLACPTAREIRESAGNNSAGRSSENVSEEHTVRATQRTCVFGSHTVVSAWSRCPGIPRSTRCAEAVWDFRKIPIWQGSPKGLGTYFFRFSTIFVISQKYTFYFRICPAASCVCRSRSCSTCLHKRSRSVVPEVCKHF